MEEETVNEKTRSAIEAEIEAAEFEKYLQQITEDLRRKMYWEFEALCKDDLYLAAAGFVPIGENFPQEQFDRMARRGLKLDLVEGVYKPPNIFKEFLAGPT